MKLEFNSAYTQIVLGIVGVILFVAVAIPIVYNTVTSVNNSLNASGTPLSTTDRTILFILPTMVVIAALVYVVYTFISG